MFITTVFYLISAIGSQIDTWKLAYNDRQFQVDLFVFHEQNARVQKDVQVKGTQ